MPSSDDPGSVELDVLKEEFILHFGEMGSRWGINRTVGQIYAYIFLSEQPVCADDLTATLRFSRSNVSMGLKELQSWNLISLKHIPGDRRDFFVTYEDLWTIVRVLVEQRKQREIDPTLTKLRELEMQGEGGGADPYVQTRISELRELIELLSGWYDDMKQLETERLVQLLAVGKNIQKFIGKAEKILPINLGKSVAGQ